MATGGTRLESLAQLETVLREVADGITVQAPDDAALRERGRGAADGACRRPRCCSRCPCPSSWSGSRSSTRTASRSRSSGCRAAERSGRGPGGGDHLLARPGDGRAALVERPGHAGFRGRPRPLRDQRLPGHHRPQAGEDALRLLAEAGELLAESLDYERTLRRLAEIAVPRLADWCMVYTAAPDGSIQRLAVQHARGLHTDVLAQLRHYEFDLDSPTGVPYVIRTGEPLLAPDATSAMVAADVHGADALAVELDSLGICSWMCLPLRARGRTLGALSLLAAESGRRFGDADLALAVDLARRAAVAIDNARLYEEARSAARDSIESFTLLEPARVGAGRRRLLGHRAALRARERRARGHQRRAGRAARRSHAPRGRSDARAHARARVPPRARDGRALRPRRAHR